MKWGNNIKPVSEKPVGQTIQEMMDEQEKRTQEFNKKVLPTYNKQMKQAKKYIEKQTPKNDKVFKKILGGK